MAENIISNVRIAGIVSVIPSSVRTSDDDVKSFGEEALKINESLGVKNRHIVKEGQCVSDLCLVAGRQLIKELDWSTDTIDVLIFITQTPDYILPATACILHRDLGLAKTCAAFDVNLGCSGYMYGLWLASSLIKSGSANRVLILVGDTSSRVVSPHDRSVATLFGDAGTATALEKAKEGAMPMFFKLGTDGKGAQNLIVPAGGFRQPRSIETKKRNSDAQGNLRGPEDLYMNGPEIFTFVISEIIPLISSTLAYAGLSVNTVDAFVMHQANLFMLKYVAKRLNIPTEKLLLTLAEYGNTSSASIPLTITHHFTGKNRALNTQLVLAGFGVGYSWGAVALNLDKDTVLPNVVVM